MTRKFHRDEGPSLQNEVSENTPAGPLAGLKVVDVSTILAGPLTAQVLGDFGAEVIKVEHPVVGDSFRSHGATKDGVGFWWKIISRNKSCITLNLSRTAGADILKRLLADADVLIENFRPGTLERWGLGPEDLFEINPRLVIARITGFGQTGPYSSRPGFGTLAEAMSGFAAVTGQPDGPPTLPPMGLADTLCGISGVSGVMMALWHRDHPGGSGRGQVVDLSLLEPMMCAVGPGVTVYGETGELQSRNGNRSTSNAPRNTYRTRDGRWLAISTSATTIAERVMELVGLPEVVSEPWFASASGRAQHVDLLDGAVARWIAERDEVDVVAAFAEANAAIAPVYTAADVSVDPHLLETEMVTTVPDIDFEELQMLNVLFRMSETPGSIRHTGRRLSEDTDEVLGSLGIGTDERDELRKEGVIR